MKSVKLRTGTVFARNLEALRRSNPPRIIVNQGGTRSGKTYDILNLLTYAGMQFQDEALTISVVRKYNPQLRDSVFRDFESILRTSRIVPESYRMPKHMNVQIGRTLYEFFGCDQAQKIRGRKRNLLYINEANEIDLDTFRQLVMRTTGTIFMDYNPSMADSYIYDYVLNRPDAILIKSTYRDNPFLDASLIREIEALRDTDPNYWRVYGLGERANLLGTIYDGRWDYLRNAPEDVIEKTRKYGHVAYGLDFGWVNPSAAYRVTASRETGAAIIERVFHEPHLHNEDIAHKLLEYMNRRGETGVTIWADSADADRIEWLQKNGLRTIRPVKKTEIMNGIVTVRQFMQYIEEKAVEYQKEIQRYRMYSDKNGVTKDVPVKMDDHGLDAVRYALTSVFTTTKKGLMFA